MAKNRITDLSTTAADNTDLGNIGIQGTNTPSNFDNALRYLGKMLADADQGAEPVRDTWTFADPADLTKRVRLDAGNVAPGETRVLMVPDRNIYVKGVASICEGRLTLTSGVPVTIADVVGAGTLYLTPYHGCEIGLYSAGQWVIREFSETSLLLSELTAGKPYDVFGYDSSGALTLESLSWIDDLTRSTALTTQDGVLVKSGDASRRYLGTIYTSGSGITEDSAAKRYVWNLHNRRARPMQVMEDTNTWNYTIPTVRQANDNSTNQLDFVRGLDEDEVVADVRVIATNGTVPCAVRVFVGLDSTTTRYRIDHHPGRVPSRQSYCASVCAVPRLSRGR